MPDKEIKKSELGHRLPIFALRSVKIGLASGSARLPGRCALANAPSFDRTLEGHNGLLHWLS